tara:strand:+ start:1124 stop:1957 length:834 start_codon:yes stop_codon:yes gene_type:complete
MTNENPEIGRKIDAAGISTNYHDEGDGFPVLLIHGSGPGVSAWANWRLNLPELAKEFRVIAPDIVGFGFTERPPDISYDLETWKKHLIGLLDALELDKVGLVGNSFGGALTLAIAAEVPDRVERFVLMGSAGLSFPITDALERIWGYEPSIEEMRYMLDLMAFDRGLVNDELAELRYRASIREGFQESYSAMFPAPRQERLDALTTPEDTISAIPHEALVIHGREDRILPVEVAYRLVSLLDKAQLHVFGRCGHWTQIEHAQRFNRLVADFFREGLS